MATTTETLSSANDLLSAHNVLISRVRTSQQCYRRQLCALQSSPPHQLLVLPVIQSPESPLTSHLLPPSCSSKPKALCADLPPAKRARVAKFYNYVPEEETIRNDYSQRYVDGGEWPQNWVLGAEPEHRFEEYPKQQRLLNLKKISVENHCLPPFYLPFVSLKSLLPCKFDVILLDPPFSSSFTWEDLQELPIPALAADPSFVFLWVGSGAGEGLERGREILARWGYRRCEDVVWVKTNKTTNLGPGTDRPTTSLLTRTKQHCLIGIRGTVRRSTDSWFVHCNVDTDVMIWEGDLTDPTRKPPEMYTLIENFCLGTRRLEVFGKASSSLRRGWVTVLAEGQKPGRSRVEGRDFLTQAEYETTSWDRETWENGIRELAKGGKYVVPMTSDIDALRPKSPFRPGGGGGGSSGGTALGIGVGGMRGGQSSEGMFRNAGSQYQRNLGQGHGLTGIGVNMLGGSGHIGLGVDGMVPVWPGAIGLGNVGVPGIGNMSGLGVLMGGHQGHMTELGMGSFNARPMQGFGMGWPGIGAEVQAQFLESPGTWDGADGVMGVGMGAPLTMTNMASMSGLLTMDDWGTSQFNGYH